MTEHTILDEETKNLHASVEKAGAQGDKTVRFPVKKEMIDALVEANDSVQNGENDIPEAEKGKFGNMLGNVFGVIGDAMEGTMEGIDDWWNKPVRDMADGTPQTRGQKWSRRLSKGFDATVDFASEAIQTIIIDFQDIRKDKDDNGEKSGIEEIIIDLPLLLGKQLEKGLDWLNEWIKGWDLNPKDKPKEQTQEKETPTKNLSEPDRDNRATQNLPESNGKNGRTENIPSPQERMERCSAPTIPGKTENIPSPQGNKEVSKPKLPHQETRNIPLAQLLDRKSR